MSKHVYLVCAFLFLAKGFVIISHADYIRIIGKSSTQDTKISGIYNEKAYNYGGSKSLDQIYNPDNNEVLAWSTMLLRFDLSAIPSGATINAATAQVYRTNIALDSVGRHVGLAPLAQAWIAGTGTSDPSSKCDGCTWLTHNSGTVSTPNWDEAEGLYYIDNVADLADDPVIALPHKFVRYSDDNNGNDAIAGWGDYIHCTSISDLKGISGSTGAYYYDGGASKLWISKNDVIHWYTTGDLWPAGAPVTGSYIREVVAPDNGGTGNGWYAWDVKDHVVQWTAGTLPNYGWRLAPVECTVQLEASKADANQPFLDVWYTPPPAAGTLILFR